MQVLFLPWCHTGGHKQADAEAGTRYHTG